MRLTRDISLLITGLIAIAGVVVIFAAMFSTTHRERVAADKREALEAIIMIEPELNGYSPDDLKVVDNEYIEYEEGHLLRLSKPSMTLLQGDQASTIIVIMATLFLLFIGVGLLVVSIYDIHEYRKDTDNYV